MPHSATSELHEQVGFNLVLLARLYRRELDAALRPHGLSEANTLPLRYLARVGTGVRQGALAQALDLEGPSLIRVLDQLEELGYIERLDHPEDRRAKIIALTAAGVALNRTLKVDLAKLRKRLFRDIDQADLEVCLRAFEVMSGNLRQVRAVAEAG
jgi:MarR family transcriptional regulator for hemolysin